MIKFHKKLSIRIPEVPSEFSYHAVCFHGLEPRHLRERWDEVFSLIVELLAFKAGKIYYEFILNPTNKSKSAPSIERLKEIFGTDSGELSYISCDESKRLVDPDYARSIMLHLERGEVIVSFGSTLIQAHAISKDLCKLMNGFDMKYGFLTHGPNTAFVAAWCLGVIYEGMTDKDRSIVQRLRDGRSVLDDHLHELYDVNFISSKHLSRPIEGVSLERWIAIRGLGQVRFIFQDTYIWELEVEQIKEARQALIASGIIF